MINDSMSRGIGGKLVGGRLVGGSMVRGFNKKPWEKHVWGSDFACALWSSFILLL